MRKTIFALGVTIGLGWAAAGVAQAGDPSAGEEKAQACAACHGADGNSPSPENPKLAGQGEPYLIKQLQDYRDTRRQNPIMEAQVGDLSDEDIRDIAAFYAQQEVETGEADEELVDLGERIYRGGNPNTGVSACVACHGTNGQGNPEAKFPSLGGQHAQYTAEQLRLFRTGERDNDAGQMMRNIAERMSDQEIEAVSSYIEGLH